MAKEKTTAAPPATDPDLAAELDAAREKLSTLEAMVESLEGELRYTKANRDAITAERAAMWRDYCRLREALLRAFPEIPDPAAQLAVGAAIAAGQSH